MRKGCKRAQKDQKNQQGMSMLESLPLILVLAGLIGFLLGMWGMTHKNTLHSIAARNYAFETFNHRANLTYFNDVRSVNHSYVASGLRFHAIGDGDGGSLKALTTPVRFPASTAVSEPAELHTQRIWESSKVPVMGEATVGTKLSWVMVGYGICLNSRCGE
ncbi:MAG: hypothetical protein ACRBBP_08495 [Bdellovibrionales bacterium]